MIKNCTPHPIAIRSPSGNRIFEPSGIVPRVATVETPADPVGGIPAVTTRLGEVSGLPDAVPGTWLIVSRMVFDATDREDVVAPDTGATCVRDEKGRIVAVTRLIRK